MFPKVNPTKTASWKKLQDHSKEMKHAHIKELFIEDPKRFKKFSLAMPEIIFDFSKNIINETTRQLLLELAYECELQKAIKAMFTGEIINGTEGRSVLHTALRNFSGKPVYSEGKDVMPEVKKELENAYQINIVFKNDLINQCRISTQFQGKPLKYVLNIIAVSLGIQYKQENNTVYFYGHACN